MSCGDNACCLLCVFVVRAMFYTRIRFVRMDPVSGVVVATRDVYLPSGPTSHIVDLNEWFESHVERLSNTIEKYVLRVLLGKLMSWSMCC